MGLAGLAARAYAGEHDRSHPEISPVHGDLTGLPPLHVERGQCEMLRDQQKELCERAEAAGVMVDCYEAPYMVHVYPLFSFAGDNDHFEPLMAFDRIVAFLNEQMGLPVPPASHAPKTQVSTRPHPCQPSTSLWLWGLGAS